MRMLPFSLSLALTIALTCTLRLSAQEPAAHSSSSFLDLQAGTTETELVTRALAQNPTLAAARQEIEIGRGGLNQARPPQKPGPTPPWHPQKPRPGNPRYHRGG